jgi:Integrase core domain
MQNGYIESFNGHMRDELLDESLFLDLDQARQINEEAAFIARPQNAGGLCRLSHRN